MADGSVPAPQYPSAPAQPVNALMSMNPLQVIATANYATQLQANRSALASQQATGEAYQGALNPDGSIAKPSCLPRYRPALRPPMACLRPPLGC